MPIPPEFSRIATVTSIAFTLFAATSIAGERRCSEVSGSFVDVYNGGTITTGRVKHGGILNGPTETIYTSDAFPTPVPTIVSYIANMTITTARGRMRTQNTYLYSFETGLFTILALIDPGLSTGRFAGATGVLYINGETNGHEIPITYSSAITGQICFARDQLLD